MGDAALSKVNDTIKPQSSGSESNQLIPTAIVKPKYQKLAFDDRQLPVVGSTDNNDSPWFDSNETASTITTTTPRKVQKHLPNFDRRSQKPSFVKQQRKLLNKSDDRIAVNAVSEKEAINSVRYSEKDVDCSSISKNIPNSVAIVQPQKKYDVNSTDKVKDDKPSLVKSFPSDSEIKLKIAETFAITKGPEIKSNSIAIKKKEVKENTGKPF